MYNANRDFVVKDENLSVLFTKLEAKVCISRVLFSLSYYYRFIFIYSYTYQYGLI